MVLFYFVGLIGLSIRNVWNRPLPCLTYLSFYVTRQAGGDGVHAGTQLPVGVEQATGRARHTDREYSQGEAHVEAHGGGVVELSRYPLHQA